MNKNIFVKTYSPPAVDQKMILHYAGTKYDDLLYDQISLLLKESLPFFSYKVAYCRLPIRIENTTIDLSFAKTDSSDLAKNLSGCSEIILFAATIGLQADRLISKYSRLSPAKALLIQAIGTERVEGLCDFFCAELKNELRSEGLAPRPRFSPGYGDLPLSLQKEIIARLDCTKNIGISLSQQLLMTPSKSVTAIIGLEEIKSNEHHTTDSK